MKIIGWDIESSALVANFGTIICIGWQVFGRPTVRVPSVMDFNGFCKSCNQIHDPTNDKKLLEHIYPILAGADAWVTWFGKGFDEKFVNTRLLYHHMHPLPHVPHIDGWKTAKGKLKLNSNRLMTVQSFLELPDSKSALSGPHWVKAKAGDKAATRYIIHHCRQDVKVLEQAYMRLRPLIIEHPNMSISDGRPGTCTRCGSWKVQRRGYYVTRSRKYARFQCQACGGWMKNPRSMESSKLTDI